MYGSSCVLVLVVVAALFVVGGLGAKRYDGYRVLRVDVNASNVADMHDLAEKLLLDVWAVNLVEGWMDVMVPPTYVNIFDAMSHKVHVNDVQELLDQNALELSNVAPPAVGDFPFTTFPTYGAILTWLNSEIAAHPNIARQIILGQTTQGTDIIGVEIGNPSLPLIFIHCTIHAREWISTTSCLWIIDQLLNNQQNAGLYANHKWVLVPVFNIDGYQYTFTNDRLWRKNRAPVSGSTCLGTDVNRNFGYGWGGAGASANPCAETFRGSGPWSSSEASSERSFLQPYIDTSRLAIYFDIHAYGAYFMSSWGYTTSLPPDFPAMRSQMTRSVAAIRNVNGRTYTSGASSVVLYLTSGGTTDYTYGDGGVVQSYVIECFGSSFTPPASYIPVIGAEVWEGVKSVAINI